MTTADDQRLARISRLLRKRQNLRQADLSTPRFIAQEIEAGRIGLLRVDAVRAHFAGLGAKAGFSIWWNGASLDRLLDEDHAQVVDVTAGTLPSYGFDRVHSEFSFNDYGERGSIDLFAARDDAKAVFVGEAKSAWGSLEETLRRQGMKVRLAPKLARAAFGWTPEAIASVLIFPNDRTARRVADRYRATLAAYPARGREIRAWLSRPEGPLGGIWFVTNAETVRRGNGDSSEIE